MEKYIQGLQIMKIFSQFFGFLLQIAPEAIGAFIAVWGSLWLFKKQTRRENHAMNKNLQLLISSSIKNAENQVENFSKLVREIEAKPTKVPELSLVSKTNLTRLNKFFDAPSSLVAYLETFGNKDETVRGYRAMSDYTDFILQRYQEAHESYANWRKLDSDRKLLYVSQIENILKVCKKTEEEFRGKPNDMATIMSEHL